MNKLYTFILFIVALTGVHAASAETLTWDWAHGAGSSDSDNARAIAVDPFGNVVVTGTFTGPSLKFGSTTLTQAGGGDMFLVKYTSAGAVKWAVSCGGANADDARSVGTDADGNIIVAGSFSSPTITFGTVTLTNSGGSDLYVVKYDTAGSVLWAKSTGGSGDEVAQAISVDAHGNTFVTGWFTSIALPFGFSTLGNSGDYDVFLAKYDPAGNTLWANSGAGPGYDVAYSVRADNKGGVYVAGLYGGATLAFGGVSFTNVGGYDMFLVKYDTLGNVQWGMPAGGTGNEEATSVTTDADGSVYVAGNFTSATLNFGTFSFTNAGQGDMFLIRLTAGGSVIWIRKTGSIKNEEVTTVATDENGYVYMCGRFASSTLTIGDMTLTNTNIDKDDIFLARYDPLGNGMWSRNAGGTNDDIATCMAVANANTYYLCGRSKSAPLNFGALPAITNAGGADVFTAKMRVTTGIDNFREAPLLLHPNPAVDYLHVDGVEAGCNYRIRDYLGRQVAEGILTSNEITLPQLPDGMYLLQVADQRQTFLIVR